MSAKQVLAEKTVFVTGATGFLGGALVRKLAADGALVKALARSEEKAQPLLPLKNVEVVYGDINDIRQMRAAIAGSTFVFHVAAMTRGKLDHQLETNVGGTHNIATAAAENDVQRLIHVSTIATYGYGVRGIVTEDTPQQPGDVPYNLTKLEGEYRLREIASETGLEYSIIRPGTIYGSNSGFWTDALLRLAKMQPTPFVGDGSGTSYLIHVDDVVEMMAILATHPAAANQAFNSVMDPPPTWREYMRELQKLAGHERWLALPLPLMVVVGAVVNQFLRLTEGSQDLARLIPFIASDVTYSMDKARTLLGWQPSISLAAGMERTIPYLKENSLL